MFGLNIYIYIDEGSSIELSPSDESQSSSALFPEFNSTGSCLREMIMGGMLSSCEDNEQNKVANASDNEPGANLVKYCDESSIVASSNDDNGNEGAFLAKYCANSSMVVSSNNNGGNEGAFLAKYCANSSVRSNSNSNVGNRSNSNERACPAKYVVNLTSEELMMKEPVQQSITVLAVCLHLSCHGKIRQTQ